MITSIINMNSFKNGWKRYQKEQSASIAMIAAFVLPVVIGMVALGTDASLWMM